ncbi:MAG TPA: hypothetical protein VKQ27_09255 [Acetobacteraceae bacterium]|nr:hypothetical protein [Acetobacteraceae bacterium]
MADEMSIASSSDGMRGQMDFSAAGAWCASLLICAGGVAVLLWLGLSGTHTR